MTTRHEPDPAQAFQAVRRAVCSMPYARTIGFDLAFEGGAPVGRLGYAEQLIGNPAVPALHGGVIAALLQLTAASKLMLATGSLELPRLFGCNLEYLATPRLVDTYAVATLTSRSRRFANLRVTAYQEKSGPGVAAATVQFLLVD